ncbi:MAG: hypothetical protein AAF787_17795 [Chloroflexota bacterium]
MRYRLYYKIPIDELDLNDRVHDFLLRIGIRTVGDAIRCARYGNSVGELMQAYLPYRFDVARAHILQKLKERGFMGDDLYDVPIEILELDVNVYNWFRRTGVTHVGDVIDVMYNITEARLIPHRPPRNTGYEEMMRQVRDGMRANGYLTYDMARDELREWFAARYPGGVDDLKRELVAQGHLPPDSV